MGWEKDYLWCCLCLRIPLIKTYWLPKAIKETNCFGMAMAAGDRLCILVVEMRWALESLKVHLSFTLRCRDLAAWYHPPQIFSFWRFAVSGPSVSKWVCVCVCVSVCVCVCVCTRERERREGERGGSVWQFGVGANCERFLQIIERRCATSV